MLNNFNMSASVSLFPKVVPVSGHNVVVTRGATGILNFNLQSKVYRFADIDQFSYTLAYGRTLKTFKMFTYFIATQDSEVISGKTYYTIQRLDEETNQCTATAVTAPSANPARAGYYEVTEQPVSWREEAVCYTTDPHFIWDVTSGYEYISLRLNANETRDFPAGEIVECEAAIRLNTDGFESLGSRDSIIIEPQPSLFVVDSLSARAGG